MPRRFSPKFPTFEEWLEARQSAGGYVGRIVRTHFRYPSATLGQLRRHPAREQAPLSELPRAPVHRVPLMQLSAKEGEQRRRALDVLSKVRRGEGSLSKLAQAARIAPKTVRRAAGAFGKQGGRWVATRYDRVQRFLKTYENGARTEVLISDSRTASLLSRYAHAVWTSLERGEPTGLLAFVGRTYRDALGKVHKFETRPDVIRAAVESSESDFGAFADLYAEPETAEDSE